MSTTTLKELLHTTNEITDLLIESGGELTPEIEDKMRVSEVNLPKKIDSYSFILDRLKSEAAYFKQKADFYSSISKACKNAQERLKDNVKHVMISSDESELLGNDIKFKLSKTKPSLHIDETKISKEYRYQEVREVIDKEKIREDLELGVPVQGASLVPSFSLRTYANKSSDKSSKKKGA